MASIVQGYNYDIFISYRQKDNKHDGWVTEFVDNLKGELESTFKEEISVYFDINPHDGLLETYDVDESLKDKLKCVIFIPIISRTYCDPNSFAWEHEFKAFVEQASQDQFGLKVKLPNGNIAGRVLPVQIHDLDQEDILMFKTVTGSILRGIEFFYKEPGVNRPLIPTDSEDKNLNRTNYRNQINKVANAIDEIISAIKMEPESLVKEKDQDKESVKEVTDDDKAIDLKQAKEETKPKILIPVIVVLLLIIAGIIAYPKIFRQDTIEKLRASGERISVAVMPFQNLTNDSTLNVWQDGIQINLITYISNNPSEIQVRQSESVANLLNSKGITSYASLTPSVARKISQKLDAQIFVSGNINQSGSTLRLNAQIIDSNSEDLIKSFQIDGKSDNILILIDSLSLLINNFLIISKLENELPGGSYKVISTNSPEAYRYYINGLNASYEEDFSTAVKLYSQALEIDTNFIDAAIRLSYAYFNLNLYEEGKKLCLRVYARRDEMPFQLKILTNFTYSIYFETFYETIACLKQLQNFDDQEPVNYYNLATLYYYLYEYDKAISECEKGLELYKKWESKPRGAYVYVFPGIVYHKTKQYNKEKGLYEAAEEYFPNDAYLNYNQAILGLTIGDTIAANKYIEKFRSIRRGNSWPEADIIAVIASIYSEADLLDKAEEYYRLADKMQSDKSSKLSMMQPNNTYRLNNLVWFLIEKDRNIEEGIELADKELKLQPDNYLYLDCKGWGLYKQRKYEKALEFIQKSWTLKPIYDHDIYLHLEAAKRAVANQRID
jgi:tetratricopeptide (TPR) repeat protein